MKPRTFLTILLVLGATLSCKKTDEPVPVKEPVAIQLPAKADEVINRSNAFGIDLFKKVCAEEEGNLMLSPLSASTALNMLLNGCKTETYEQIKNMLGYEGLTQEEINAIYKSLVTQLLEADPDVTLDLANAVWYRLGFDVHASYFDTMSKVFQAHIEGLDFAQPTALETMNQWASDNTNGKIEKVLDEISPEAVMFLMNALYFKGTWTYQFDPGQTGEASFSLGPNDVIQVPVMNANFPVKFIYGDLYIAAELMYGRQNFSMIVVVPTNDWLPVFIESLDAAEWESITTTFDNMEPSKMDVHLPKFKFDFEKKLNDQLMALGMTDAFSPMLADLSGISDSQIFVSFVKQNTFVEVNEEGTEAAAVTTIGIELTALEDFTVDRPFLFAIRERTTNTLLFIGKVTNPLN